MITLGSICASLITTSILLILFTGGVSSTALIIAALVPIIAGVPVTTVFDRQRQKVKTALAELETAHRQLECLNSELKLQATHDYMTGVFNRRHFVKLVSEARKACPHGTLICIDVDDFKRINDTYGHNAGDLALKAITSTICELTHDRDIVARIGGEEFAIFVHHACYEEILNLSERIRTAIETMSFSPAEGKVHDMSVSIGIAFVAEAGDFDSLVNKADKRMYDAKETGKNRIVLSRIEGSLGGRLRLLEDV